MKLRPVRFSLLDLMLAGFIAGLLGYHTVGFALLFVEPLPEPAIQVYWDTPAQRAERVLAEVERMKEVPFDAWLALGDGDLTKAAQLMYPDRYVDLSTHCGRYQLAAEEYGRTVQHWSPWIAVPASYNEYAEHPFGGSVVVTYDRPAYGEAPRTITMEFSIPRAEFDRLVRELEQKKAEREAEEKYRQYLRWFGWWQFWRFA